MRSALSWLDRLAAVCEGRVKVLSPAPHLVENMCGEYASRDQVDELIEMAKDYVDTQGRLNYISF